MSVVLDIDGETGAATPPEVLENELRHDLRQPLAMVGLLVDSLLLRDDLDGEIAAQLARIRDQNEWMEEILRSREPGGEVFSVVDLADAVQGPCSASPVGAPYDVRFLPADDADVLVDPVGLRRAAWNLMDNARRAVARGGRVESRVVCQGGHARLEVADSGPGFGRIPAQHGHGLAGVRRFAARCGGEVVIGSSSLGGALVSLKLPLVLTGTDASGL